MKKVLIKINDHFAASVGQKKTESHIKLCPLLGFKLSNTMKLLLSILRDFPVRCRQIALGFNRIQSAHC